MDFSQVIIFNLSTELKGRIKAHADREGLSMAALIRSVLIDFLDRSEGRASLLDFLESETHDNGYQTI
jgi:plasmid stability protein